MSAALAVGGDCVASAQRAPFPLNFAGITHSAKHGWWVSRWGECS
ncbi:hypothetical protein [Rhodococcus sp. UFZ-B548]|nr:hypothetical protein [Rhodococcus sp. UFZ-B548]